VKNFDNNTEVTYVLYNNNGKPSTNWLICPLLLRLIVYKRDINIGIYFCLKIYIAIYYDQILLINKTKSPFVIGFYKIKTNTYFKKK